MLASLAGLDHVVVLVRDLDQAATAWRRLGFTLSPRGTHSAHLGTGNYTIMFGPDYVELLGVLTDTAHNAPSRAMLDSVGEGIERAAFRALDAERLVKDLHARGIAATGPLDFGRPVALPNGLEAQARFRTVHWPLDQRPGGLRIFACQHETPDAVWIPELTRHANGVRRILRLDVASDDPATSAAQFAGLVDGAAGASASGFGWSVMTAPHRAAIHFVTPAALALLHPGVDLAGSPAQGGVALTLQVDDLDATTMALGSAGISGASAVSVPPAAANGVLLRFTAEQRDITN